MTQKPTGQWNVSRTERRLIADWLVNDGTARQMAWSLNLMITQKSEWTPTSETHIQQDNPPRLLTEPKTSNMKYVQYLRD
jgi:hypothetical protein